MTKRRNSRKRTVWADNPCFNLLKISEKANRCGRCPDLLFHRRMFDEAKFIAAKRTLPPLGRSAAPVVQRP